MSLFAAQFRMWLSPAAMTSAARDHVKIVDALAARDARTAERVMRRHIQQSARAILALPDDAFA
jgi:DNA-binding GntR family transcriptional regulator